MPTTMSRMKTYDFTGLTTPSADLFSLVPEGFDRVQPGRSIGRVDAEEQPDRDRDEKREKDRRDRHHGGREAGGGDRRKVRSLRRQRAAGYAQRPAQAAENHRLDEELGEDVAPARADGLADADLARPLGDGDQHDVHDSDPAHDERDAGDRAQHEGQGGGDRGRLVEDVLLALELKVGLARVADLVALHEDRGDLRFGIGDGARRRGRGHDLADHLASGAGEVGPYRRYRRHDDVVLGAEA